MADAPYTGGTAPGGRIFAVDGDFTVCSPCGAPEIYNPLPGDSVPSVYPIILLDRTLGSPDYVSLPIGTGFNVQDFAANQQAIVIEQEFMVAQSAYFPMPLNTPYNIAWSVGWLGTYLGLESCFLVEEGPHIPAGGGLIRFKRKFASLPPNRNEYESYCASYPAINYGVGEAIHRFGLSRIVNSRLFYEYFVYDNLNLLPGIALFPAGHRINTGALGTDAKYLEFEQFAAFKADANSVNNNNLLGDDPLDALVDGPPATTPSSTTYQSWLFDNPSEIVAEASSFSRWMGNIYVRRTRFVLAI